MIETTLSTDRRWCFTLVLVMVKLLTLIAPFDIIMIINLTSAHAHIYSVFHVMLNVAPDIMTDPDACIETRIIPLRFNCQDFKCVASFYHLIDYRV